MFSRANWPGDRGTRRVSSPGVAIAVDPYSFEDAGDIVRLEKSKSSSPMSGRGSLRNRPEKETVKLEPLGKRLGIV